MNIAFFLKPKNEIAYLYDDYTLRQGLEKMKHHGYTAIPVINKDGCYVTTISEGDFLWYILKDAQPGTDIREIPMESLEEKYIKDLMHIDKNPPVYITATVEELVERAMEQNFIPVIDDSGSFIGIITRRNLLESFAKQGNKV